MSAFVHSHFPPGLVRWRNGSKPRDRAAFAVAALDVDNLLGNYRSIDEGAARIHRAGHQVQALLADVAHRAQVFAFVQVHRPRSIADAIDEMSRQYGFVIVHCPRKATDGTDDVDVHMKRFLRNTVYAYTDDIPIVICSGDHTFAEEVGVVSETHRVYVGSLPNGTSHDLYHGSATGLAWLLPQRSDAEKLAIVLGTSTGQVLDALRDVLAEPIWKELWVQIRVAKERLVHCHRAFKTQRYRDPIQGVASAIALRNTFPREVAGPIVQMFYDHGLMTFHKEEGGPRALTQVVVHYDHPLFQLDRPQPGA